MSASWKERKGVAVALGIVALLVWGSVGYTVWEGLQSDDDLASSAMAPPAGRRTVPVERAAFAYAGDFRDPFAPQLLAAVEEAVEPQQEADWVELPVEPEPEWPEVKLLGIVGDTALLEMDGYTQLVRVGDYLNETQIVAINADHLILQAGDARRSIPLS